MGLLRARVLAPIAIAAATAAAVTAGGAGAQGPPAPTAVNGAPVETLASGIPTPTAFAVAKGQLFVAAGGTEDGKTPGGIFAVANGQATPVAGTEGFVKGLAFSKGTLYASTNTSLVAYRGWNGTGFASKKTVFRGPKGFPGFGGIAVGPDGRIYGGTYLDPKYDHKKSPQPYAQSVLSLSRTGKKVRVLATGLRQPWQLTFKAGDKRPYVSVLSQDNLKKAPPDYIVHVKAGQDYGFPTCTQVKAKPCKRFTKPYALLPGHSSPMGISTIGSTFYIALFGGTGKGPEVATWSKGKLAPFLTGFAAPVVAVTTDGGYVYAGDLTGSVYRVKA
jgi:glucose/arabinose dehydrogenase